MIHYDVIIVGSGPSSFMCSINIKNKTVLLLESNEKLGGKIEVSGNGRCNVTNNKPIDLFMNYILRNNKFLYTSLNNYGPKDIISFFENHNCPLKEEDNNRFFPVSNNSKDIVNVFIDIINKSNKIEYRTNYLVEEIEFIDDKYVVNNTFKCNKLVVATGGVTYPNQGTKGFGYDVAKQFGHTIKRPWATESPLISEDLLIKEKELQGVTFKQHVINIYVDGKRKISTKDDILITHFGLSGPGAILNSYFIKEKLFKSKRIDLEILLDEDSPSKALKVCNENKLMFNIIDTKGFNTGVVTAGGINVKEIDPKTFESKVKDDLYFIGEVLDINSNTGGYNITTCFSEGYNCGINI
ncbi:MAG: NAD(P)/FAD-dependent oxidoreductase [Mycoplasmatales bacterium]